MLLQSSVKVGFSASSGLGEYGIVLSKKKGDNWEKRKSDVVSVHFYISHLELMAPVEQIEQF